MGAFATVKMLAFLTTLFVLATHHCARAQFSCSAENQRYPVNNDISVNCGPQHIELTINICPVLYAGFQPSVLALNSRHNETTCFGTVDNSTSPPVIRYTFLVNETSQHRCGNNFEIIETGPGSGLLSDFSHLQAVIISGYIDTPQSLDGVISYATDLYYIYKCEYPLEYLLNNTKLITSSASVAVTTNNGSFISTLSMKLYSDLNYSTPLIVSNSGIPLKTNIYVQVSASNLTERDIETDIQQKQYEPVVAKNGPSLHAGFYCPWCHKEAKTTIVSNGRGTSSQFYFDAFRFLEHRDKPVSTIYLRCVCNSSSGSRRKREAVSPTAASTVTDAVTVSGGPIYTVENDLEYTVIPKMAKLAAKKSNGVLYY
ncbi:zona pellucida-like domain-containing protein 1 [Latimeria chalumnae]|uniref:zona pellucida-like domain-containing protein 1 n=1 Tax=Latimeria chalumnae TaxID=7897 RepID=UPI0006D90716|nr:PREDICTED: zona pellucida-like domain-containing protein 1 [Latimeria chalumnae]|eukprot:XP_014345382.1 PREDICTED: zona pellucida-like domain-containing protein 1 [Latimeria chalumnae]